MAERTDRPLPLPAGAPPEAFLAALYERYAPDIRRLAVAWTRDPELADDVAQETFLKAHRSLDSFDRGRPAWPWLSSIAKNAAIDALRRKHRSLETPSADLGGDLDPSGDPGDPEAFLLRTERRRAIDEAMRSLSNRHRRLLVLRDAEEWGREDIAASEGISLESVKGVLWRARRAFRERYERIAEERGLRGFVWPVLGPLLIRMRNLRARIGEQTIGLGPVAVGLPQVAAGAIAATIAATALVSTSSSPVGGPRDTPSSLPAIVSMSTVDPGERPDALRAGSPEPAAQAPTAPRRTSTAVSTREVAPTSPAEAGATGTLENGERATVSARVWTRIGQKEPGAGTGLELYCDSEVRQRLCDAIDGGT